MAAKLSSNISQLVNFCHKIFTRDRTTLTWGEASGIRSMMEQVNFGDLGLDKTTVDQLGVPTDEEGNNILSFCKVYETNTFGVKVFFLPYGFEMELHNHPGMFVAAHVLSGSIHLTTLDILGGAQGVKQKFEDSDQIPAWGELPGSPPEQDKQFHEKVVYSGNVVSSDQSQAGSCSPHEFEGLLCEIPEQLYPSQEHPSSFFCLPNTGNLHQFITKFPDNPSGRNKSPFTAILDVIAPPYDQLRNITYFEIHQQGIVNIGDTVQLTALGSSPLQSIVSKSIPFPQEKAIKNLGL